MDNEDLHKFLKDYPVQRSCRLQSLWSTEEEEEEPEETYFQRVSSIDLRQIRLKHLHFAWDGVVAFFSFLRTYSDYLIPCRVVDVCHFHTAVCLTPTPSLYQPWPDKAKS